MTDYEKEILERLVRIEANTEQLKADHIEVRSKVDPMYKFYTVIMSLLAFLTVSIPIYLSYKGLKNGSNVTTDVKKFSIKRTNEKYNSRLSDNDSKRVSEKVRE